MLCTTRAEAGSQRIQAGVSGEHNTERTHPVGVTIPSYCHRGRIPLRASTTLERRERGRNPPSGSACLCRPAERFDSSGETHRKKTGFIPRTFPLHDRHTAAGGGAASTPEPHAAGTRPVRGHRGKAPAPWAGVLVSGVCTAGRIPYGQNIRTLCPIDSHKPY